MYKTVQVMLKSLHNCFSKDCIEFLQVGRSGMKPGQASIVKEHRSIEAEVQHCQRAR